MMIPKLVIPGLTLATTTSAPYLHLPVPVSISDWKELVDGTRCHDEKKIDIIYIYIWKCHNDLILLTL